MPGLNTRLKNQLLSASAKALQLCENVINSDISYERHHDLHRRANPMKLMQYRLALQLYKIHNSINMNDDWIDYNFQQNVINRMRNVQLTNNSVLRIGNNRIINWPTCINNKINYNWLNKSFDSYKLLCKSLFLTWKWPIYNDNACKCKCKNFYNEINLF